MKIAPRFFLNFVQKYRKNCNSLKKKGKKEKTLDCLKYGQTDGYALVKEQLALNVYLF